MGRTEGLGGRRGRGVCQGHFWHISGPFESASRFSLLPVCDLAVAKIKGHDRKEKEAARCTSCQPRRTCCGDAFRFGWRCGSCLKKKKEKKIETPASLSRLRCVCSSLGPAKKTAPSSSPSGGDLCVSWASPLRCNECLYARSCLACPWALFSVALQSTAVGTNPPACYLQTDGRSRWTEVGFISGSSACSFAFAGSISRAPVATLR